MIQAGMGIIARVGWVEEHNEVSEAKPTFYYMEWWVAAKLLPTLHSLKNRV